MTSHLVRSLFACLVLGSSATGCRRPMGAPLPTRSTCRTRALGLGARDVLSITVFNETNLSGDFRVGEDGAIQFPYLGQVSVLHLQAGEIAEILRHRLGERSSDNPAGQNVLRDPSVRVETREINSRRISVFGQVQHPGVFPHQQCITLTQAISLSGGFTALADKNAVRVTRVDATGTRRTFVLRAEDIAEGRAPDFDLDPDDVVFVPESLT